MPTCDVAARHSIRIAADPVRVYQAARQADLGHSWIVRALMGLRTGPARIGALLANRHGNVEPACDRRVGAAGFTLIAEEPGKEFVLGIMGRFWTLSGGIISTEAHDFQRPPPDGVAQAAWELPGRAHAERHRALDGNPGSLQRCGDSTPLHALLAVDSARELADPAKHAAADPKDGREALSSTIAGNT